jgi:Clostripain family
MSPEVPDAHEWVLLYYMSYDNNLDYCEPIILDALQQGVSETTHVVSVLADDTERNGLMRYTITTAGQQVETLPTENSASEEVLADYLDWAASTLPARHYVLAFLDHGGRLDEMCWDTWPGPKAKREWLSARLVGPIIKGFRHQIRGELDLLFLQQCGRASLENLYNFRGAAPFIMASQVRVGAPNTYYRGLLQWLAANRNATGLDIATTIMSLDDHFRMYVCVDGEALEWLPSHLSPLVRALVGEDSVALKLPGGLEPCFRAEIERNYDVEQWFAAALKQNGRPLEAFTQFTSWLNNSLVLAKRVHPGADAFVSGLCGLSMFVPRSRDEFKPYEDYPLYRAGSLGELWKAAHATRRRRVRVANQAEHSA